MSTCMVIRFEKWKKHFLWVARLAVICALAFSSFGWGASEIASASGSEGGSRATSPSAADNKSFKNMKLAKDQKRNDFNNRMLELLNKSPSVHPTKRKGSSNGAQLTAQQQHLLMASIGSQIRACWQRPEGKGSLVSVRWRLKKNGELDGPPVVISPRKDVQFQNNAAAAVKAIKCAAPFNLPPESYAAWRDITWMFDATRSF